MTDRAHRNRSQLDLKVEKFFEHDSLLSESDSSIERMRPSYRTKVHKKNIDADRDQSLHTLKKSARKRIPKKDTNDETPSSSRKSHARSKSRSRKDRHLSTLKSPRVADPPVNVSSLKDNYTLRMKLNDLSKTLNQKNKQIKRLYDNIYTEKEEIRQLTIRANDASKKSMLVGEFQDKIQALQENEMHLIRELNDQQKISKDALTRLYEFQEESVKEIEDIKKYYKEFYSQQTSEVKEQYEGKISSLNKEKENLVSTMRNIESIKELERNNLSISLNNEISALKEQINLSNSENERLKDQNRDLKQRLKEQEESANFERNSFKSKIEEFSHQNRVLKSAEEDYVAQDAQEKTKLHRKVESLEKDLAEKDKIIRTKDRDYKEQLEMIHEKVQALQKELLKMGEYEAKIATLQKDLSTKESELDLAKQYYKEKLTLKKKAQSEQKNEWSDIYNELLREIRGLKSEIDSLGMENKKLLTSFGGRTLADY